MRVRTIEPNKLPGKISTFTYLISSQNPIPIVSLIVEPDFLWGDDIGIYSNEYKQREVPVTLHYIKNGVNTSFEIDAGARLGGLNIWTKPQKPFTIYTRDRFGEDLWPSCPPSWEAEGTKTIEKHSIFKHFLSLIHI